MATPPQLPEIFLSHSGQQKDFVWSLYRELLHVNHNPFFDQDSGVDSLPKAIPFPPRILEACCACKMGVVVVSHDYMESLWPMLELQHFFFHNPRPTHVFPLFYKLKPADLSKEENLTRWRNIWEEKRPYWEKKVQDMLAASDPMANCSGTSSASCLQPTLDISLWPRAIEMLRSQSGQTLPDNKDGHAFIQAIVINICKLLPPPQSFFMGDHFKGAEHIQQEIHGLFQQQQEKAYYEISDSSGKIPISVGLYGVGGAGKTTVCMYMLSFYAKEYPGNCFLLQFPTSKNETHLLVQSIKDVLSQRGDLKEETLNKIKSVEQAIPHLQQLLRRYKVFLIVDNIWDWAVLDARQILTMDYVRESRLLVTARSKILLQALSSSLNDKYALAKGREAMQIHHVPGISEVEATEALKAYSLFSMQCCENLEDSLGRLARSCFFDAQCHPLLLKAVGAELRHLGGSTHRIQDLENLCSRLQALKICGDEEIEEEIVSVLRTSYDALNPKLGTILLMLGTCVPKEYLQNWQLSDAIEWLSMACDSGSQSIENIRAQLIELEYHSLIQIYEEGVIIHDLQMMMIEKIVRENQDVPRCFFFEGDVTTLSKSQWRHLKYIYGYVIFGYMPRHNVTWQPWKGILETIYQTIAFRKICQLGERICGTIFEKVEVLKLRGVSASLMCPWVLDIGSMPFLRYLDLDDIPNLRAAGGWDGASNLVSVKLWGCPMLGRIEPMVHPSILKELNIKNLESWKNPGEFVSTLSVSGALQRCILSGNAFICKLPSLTLMDLRVLNLSECGKLKSMEGRECGLTALEELSLFDCSSLESIPDLKQLVKLRRLELWGCDALEEVKVGEVTVTTLEKLSLNYGRTRLSAGSRSALPVSAFTNLRILRASGKWFEDELGSRISLPASLDFYNCLVLEIQERCQT